MIEVKMERDGYILQAEKFLQQAEKELNEGDLRQAGEKYWGAASQAVKAFAQKKGWKHDGHAWLFETVDKLSSETKDEGLKEKFCLAGMLHTNFYEGWLTEGEIKRCGLQTKRFVSKIKGILNNGK
jgi:uncharacterized protein (UPF0332 family)